MPSTVRRGRSAARSARCVERQASGYALAASNVDPADRRAGDRASNSDGSPERRKTMHAICVDCGQAIRWRNTRGAGMPKRCAHCGGVMALATWDGDRIVRMSRHATTAGRHRAKCALCGRLGLMPGKLRSLTSVETFLIWEQATPATVWSPETERLVALPIGTIVCRSHESIERRRAAGLTALPAWPIRVEGKLEL